MINKEEVAEWMMGLQDSICAKIAIADGAGKFVEEQWKHEIEGGGRTRILQKGNILEKAGVNFSAVTGKLSQIIKEALRLNQEDFFATGVSIVMHPNSPMVPIIHMNVRYFETKEDSWFGGGIDLTPHYVNQKDAQFFHQQLKNVCDTYDIEFYPKFKNWADDYFFNKHREETRGIGGIFFDRLNEKSTGHPMEKLFEFVKELGNSFANIYTELMIKNASIKYGQKEVDWQMLRRGRYVEFNLVYDKGTKFGFETSGRTESILMSMPPQAQWEYNFKAENESPEAYTLSHLKKGYNWL